MRMVVQRVRDARVEVEDRVVGSIERGLLVFLGVARSDTNRDADYLVDKAVGLRIFPDELGKMNCNIIQAHGSLLVISQFTLYGDCRRGLRPSFDQAAAPEDARRLYEYFLEVVRSRCIPVASGIFQASMQVHLTNDGPVTILLDSEKLF
jgi:D-tyrosyl-tRNA(Tyr) deacylase